MSLWLQYKWRDEGKEYQYSTIKQSANSAAFGGNTAIT